MGAHLSTVLTVVDGAFDAACKKDSSGGQLTLRSVLALPELYDLSPSLGLLWQIDSNHDGRISRAELQDFSRWAHAYARLQRRSDGGGAGGMQQQHVASAISGAASLLLWHALRRDDTRQQVVDWSLRLFTGGVDTRELRDGVPCVHVRCLKAFHVLFDVERTQGLDYQALRALVQGTAEEQQLLDTTQREQADWLPLDVLRLLAGSVAEGVSRLLDAFFADEAEAEAVLAGVQQAADDAAAAARPTDAEPRQPHPPAAARDTGMRQPARRGSLASGNLVPSLQMRPLQLS